MLMGTVILSFFAAIGLSLLVFEAFTSFPGEDPSYPLFAFIFLVALGVDYNIFLMARVREEAHRMSTRDAMLTSLAVTGGVITSAGVVLAGTFAVLAVLPLIALTQIGDHGRARGPARHARRAVDPRARADLRARRADVVAGAVPARRDSRPADPAVADGYRPGCGAERRSDDARVAPVT